MSNTQASSLRMSCANMNVMMFTQAALKELVQWHKVSHRNIVQVSCVFNRDLIPFLVTSRIAGENLDVFLRAHGHLSLLHRMRMCKSIGCAMIALLFRKAKLRATSTINPSKSNSDIFDSPQPFLSSIDLLSLFCTPCKYCFQDMILKK